MISHEWEPPTPSKKEHLEYDIKEKLEQISRCENEIDSLKDEMAVANLGLKELRVELWRLYPDPYRER